MDTRNRKTSIKDVKDTCTHLLFMDEESYDQVIEGTTFKRCVFRRMGMKQATFSDCRFLQCVFEDSYFRKAEFRHVDFTGSFFIDCNLEKASLKSCSFWYVRFRRTLVPTDEILSSLPAEANLRRKLLASLKANAEELGDHKSADVYLIKEIQAREEELKSAFWGSSKYYKENYPWPQNLLSGLAWLRSRTGGLFWGYGLKARNLIVSIAVLNLVVLTLTILLVGGAYNHSTTDVARHVGLVDALTISLQNFSSVHLTDLTPTSFFGQLIAVSQRLFAPVALGFLAALLYRKIAR